MFEEIIKDIVKQSIREIDFEAIKRNLVSAKEKLENDLKKSVDILNVADILQKVMDEIQPNEYTKIKDVKLKKIHDDIWKIRDSLIMASHFKDKLNDQKIREIVMKIKKYIKFVSSEREE